MATSYRSVIVRARAYASPKEVVSCGAEVTLDVRSFLVGLARGDSDIADLVPHSDGLSHPRFADETSVGEHGYFGRSA